MRPALDAAIRDIAAHLGRTLTFPVYLSVNRTQQEDIGPGEQFLMYTFPCERTVPNAIGRPDGCTVHVNPIASEADFSDHDRAAFLVHEAMHCYLYDKFGDAYDRVAPWLQEGAPTWVQTAVAGGDSA